MAQRSSTLSPRKRARAEAYPPARAIPAPAPGQPARRVPKLRYIALAVVCGWAFYYYDQVQRPQLAHLLSQQQRLEAELHSATVQQAELRQKVQEFQNDDFIARYASQRFNLILPGQVSFNIQH
ncbi:MAG: hypothetical protein K6T30_07375 [Alicyclobacillus sp.]|nr:hypothetical protein [Alicyclobacillus sp.]